MSLADELAKEDVEEQQEFSGELKINEDGLLLEGRKYKCRTLILPRHPTKLYMLTFDAAKTLGYKDNYHFFRRAQNTMLRINASDDDREVLIEHDFVTPHFQNPEVDIPLVTARSVFRRFGHHIVCNGTPGVDDYWEDPKKTQSTGLHVFPNHNEYMDFKDDEDNIVNFRLLPPPDPNREKKVYVRRRENAVPVSQFDNTLSESYQQRLHSFLNNSNSKDSSSFRAPDIPANRIEQMIFETAELNSLLNKQRRKNSIYFDMHSNISQYPASTKPSAVIIQKKVELNNPLYSEDSRTVVENHVFVDGKDYLGGIGIPIGKRSKPGFEKDPDVTEKVLLKSEDSDSEGDQEEKSVAEPEIEKYEDDPDEWLSIESNGNVEYPFALLPSQITDTIPIHQHRFGYDYLDHLAEQGLIDYQAKQKQYQKNTNVMRKRQVSEQTDSDTESAEFEQPEKSKKPVVGGKKSTANSNVIKQQAVIKRKRGRPSTKAVPPIEEMQQEGDEIDGDSELISIGRNKKKELKQEIAKNEVKKRGRPRKSVDASLVNI